MDFNIGIPQAIILLWFGLVCISGVIQHGKTSDLPTRWPNTFMIAVFHIWILHWGGFFS